MYEDKILMDFVEREINSGKKKIVIPRPLLLKVSKEIITEIKRLATLNGVEIEIT